MSKSQWEQLPENFRETVIFLFAQQGLDFEKICVNDVKEPNEKSEEVSPWMTRKEAANFARVSIDTIDNWRRDERIKSNKLGNGRPGSVRISRDSLRRFLNSMVKADPHKRVRETPMKGASYRVPR